MLPVQLARTPKQSHLKRKSLLVEALYWRDEGNRKMKRVCLSMARDERLNKGLFLGDELPF